MLSCLVPECGHLTTQPSAAASSGCCFFGFGWFFSLSHVDTLLMKEPGLVSSCCSSSPQGQAFLCLTPLSCLGH